MSAVKNKNNIKIWTTDNHKQETTQTAHYREHTVGLTEQQKTVIGRDRSTPTQDMSPERLTQPKKNIFLLIKPTLH